MVGWEYFKEQWEDYLEMQDTKEGTFDNFGSYFLQNSKNNDIYSAFSIILKSTRIQSHLTPDNLILIS